MILCSALPWLDMLWTVFQKPLGLSLEGAYTASTSSWVWSGRVSVKWSVSLLLFVDTFEMVAPDDFLRKISMQVLDNHVL